ncbi:MAG: hypothetical protein ACTS3T_20785 [Almyronema sp.]
MHTQDSPQVAVAQAPVYHPLFTVGFVVLQACLVAAIPLVVGLRSPDLFSSETVPSEAALWLPVAATSPAEGN